VGKQPRGGGKTVKTRLNLHATFSGWLVDRVSLLLDSGEREVVHGDLAELGTSNRRALVDILGLVVRRQIALWGSWEPWTALLCVATPLGMLLSLISRYWADGMSDVLWLYSHDYFIDVPLSLRYATVDYLALAGWAWTCGFTIGSLARRSAWVNLLLFFAIVLGGTIGSSEIMRNDTRVFASFVYGHLMPMMVRLLFVALPAIHGLCRAVDRRPLHVAPALLVAIALVAMTVYRMKWIEASASFFGWRPFGPLPDPGFDGRIGTDDDIINWKLRFLPFVVMWPAVYMLATTTFERFKQRA
jgi:hypothetical protein